MRLFDNRKTTAFVLLVGSLMLHATTAQATPITVTATGKGQSNVPVVINNGSLLEYVFAGEIKVTITGQGYIAYCLDLFTDIGYATYNSQFDNPASYNGGARAAWIYENYALGNVTNATAAAIQLAIWDVVHDGGNGLSTGNIRLSTSASSSLRSAAEAIIAASVGKTSTNATVLHNVSQAGLPAQTLLTGGKLWTPAPVPEPGTWAMMLAGLGGLAWKGRRRLVTRA